MRKFQDDMVETCKSIPCSVFGDMPNFNDLAEAIANTDITWGGANRTLVDTDRIIRAIDDAAESEEDFAEIRAFLVSVPNGVYIDLEN